MSNTIHLLYYTDKAKAISDFEAEALALALKDSDIWTSSHFVIDCLRALIVEKKIKHNEVGVVLNDNIYGFDEDGSIIGFEEDLIDVQIAKRIICSRFK